MFKLAVLISGRHGQGSTLLNLDDACRDGRLPGCRVATVIGTVAESPALERASARGLNVAVVPTKPDAYGARLLDALNAAQPSLICLAGYMRLIPDEVLREFAGRIVNIHPALLPAFGGHGMYGSHVHEAVLEYGVKVTGCTVHYIDGEYDTGPIILQRVVDVLDADTVETLAARVQAAERQAYPEAVRLIAEGRVRIEGRRVKI